MVIGLAVVAALWRLHTAICVNHRYRFTTWGVGKIVAGLLVLGVVMKLLIATGT